MASARLQRWALTLTAYQCFIRYNAGQTFGNADFLIGFPLYTKVRAVCCIWCKTISRCSTETN